MTNLNKTKITDNERTTLSRVTVALAMFNVILIKTILLELLVNSIVIVCSLHILIYRDCEISWKYPRSTNFKDLYSGVLMPLRYENIFSIISQYSYSQLYFINKQNFKCNYYSTVRAGHCGRHCHHPHKSELSQPQIISIIYVCVYGDFNMLVF